jgi:hypothetical protein
MHIKNMSLSDMQTPPETEPQAELESPPEPSAPKPRRKRRTKAEMEAVRAAKAAKAAEEADKPIDPQVWLLGGAALLLVGGFIYIDPIGFADAARPQDTTWLQVFLIFMTGILGKNPTAIILTVLGLLAVGWGLWGWGTRRFGTTQPQPDEKTEN